MEKFKAFWESSDIKEEILVFVEENGVISATLAFDNPQNVVLRDRTGRTFEKDKDYLQRGNKVIVISEDVPYLKAEWLKNENVPRELPNENEMYHIEGCLLIDPRYLRDMQLFADYSTDKKCDLKIVSDVINLSQTERLLKEEKKIKIALFGDSISNAANSSFEMGFSGAEHWISPVIEYMQTETGASVAFRNVSRSGYGTEWALEAVDEKFAEQNVDLTIIAFGMNDGSADMSVDTFVQNVSKLIDAIKRYNSKTEFVLVATPLPNENCSAVYKEQIHYISGLRTLEGQGVTVVNMTEVFSWLLKRKRYCEISGNNLNHPNDFGYRFYTDAFKLLFYKILNKDGKK